MAGQRSFEVEEPEGFIEHSDQRQYEEPLRQDSLRNFESQNDNKSEEPNELNELDQLEAANTHQYPRSPEIFIDQEGSQNIILSKESADHQSDEEINVEGFGEENEPYLPL